MTVGRRDFLLAGAAALLPAPPRASALTVIHLPLAGGASQLDTFDPRPSGIFGPIRTNVPGIRISELFPRMARRADRFAMVRSVHSEAEPFHLAPSSGGPSFDTHGWGPFPTLSDLRDTVAPAWDFAFTSLLDGLESRGELETTLVAATTEFGRTPYLNPQGGRDHWTRCWTVIFAGGGIRGGQVYGASDSLGAEPRECPVTPDNIAATVAYALGRPYSAEPISELFR